MVVDKRGRLLKSKLTKMFGLIRRNPGVVARQNFACCSSCAGVAFGDECRALKVKDPARYAELRGLVFYHAQDADDLNSGEIYIRFMDVNNDVAVRRQLGEFIVAAALEVGLKVDWNGEVDRCVGVKLC